jgi:hypothetical protein
MHTFVAGKLYVLWHETFAQYGEDIYKIGRSVNVEDRMKNAYTTPFLTKASYKYVSAQFKDVERAERILFYLLKSERMRANREFFNISLDRAISLIKRLERLESEIPFIKLYAMMCMQIIPFKLLKALKNEEDVVSYFDNLDQKGFDDTLTMDEWFDQFRFRPSKPEVYKKMGLSFALPEEETLQKLIHSCTKEEDSLCEDVEKMSL